MTTVIVLYCLVGLFIFFLIKSNKAKSSSKKETKSQVIDGVVVAGMKSRLLLFSIVFQLLLIPFVESGAAGVLLPTKEKITKDLVGRKLSEGMDNGYFGPDWRWTVEEGEISGMKILSKKVSKDYCSFVVSMTLQKKMCPTKYHAMVQVDYSLEKNKWKLIVVKSKGVNVVKTGKYLDCISPIIYGDKYYRYLIIKNNIDSPLLVGGVYRSAGNSYEWLKFSTIIGGLDEYHLPCKGSLEDVKIHFVELY